jgi:hypothetical protein
LEANFKEDETRLEAIDRFKVLALGQLKVYVAEHMPSVNPLEVEKKILVDLGGDLPDMLCYLDRIDEGGIIVDTKFPAKSPAKDDIENDLQLTIYDMAYRAEYGKAPGGLRKEYAVGLKTPKVVIQEAPARDQEAIDRLINRIRQVVMGMKEGIYMPADSMCWWCSPKACDYWGICNYRP